MVRVIALKRRKFVCSHPPTQCFVTPLFDANKRSIIACFYTPPIFSENEVVIRLKPGSVIHGVTMEHMI